MEKQFYDKMKYPKIALVMLFIPIGIITFLLVIYRQDPYFLSIMILCDLILIKSAWWTYRTTLTIIISKDGISYELNSFNKTQNVIPNHSILGVELLALDFISKFGGWGRRKHKNEIAYVFNDGFFIKVKTIEQIYYFSISDAKKNECLEFVKLFNESNTEY